ncbi:hypothetical protein Cgig2_025596 [Carnegiea gigantea]|uniref:Uncharacterized protein n=1 Tax=Carnegiea gigantea TaxID=171969 RepID=A0A9Q1JQX2_9CARY|nr:hypothetical protein Cgig2_025596 [Carnegiea gigantea]
MEAGVELGVFATGGYLITEVSCKVGRGRVGASGIGGELDNGGPGKITYAGGSMKCIMLKEGLEIEEVRRVVTEITGNNLTVQKFTTRVVMEGERDADVRMFLKENDEHGYLYEGDSDRSKRAVVSEMGGCIGDHPQTRLRLDGKIIELSDDDEISIAFEDVSDDEAAAEGGEEGS